MIETTLTSVNRLLESKTPDAPSLFVLGCSTGGPAVLHRIIPQLPASFAAPVLVVQHMPSGFVHPLARALDRASAVPVGVAGHRTTLAPGTVWLAPADHHISVRLERPGLLETTLSDGDPVHGCRPALDPLLASVARVVGSAAVLIVLTGMGHDGTEGASRLRKSGGTVIAQDEASSQVYGMPRSIAEENLADAILPPDAITRFMVAAGTGDRHG